MTLSSRAEPRRLSILGATGSIGRSTLDVVAHMGGREAFEITAVTGMGNVALLAAQARLHGVRFAATADPTRYQALKEELSGSGIACGAGPAP